MKYCSYNQYQNNAGGLVAAFDAASITGQRSPENAASVKQLTTGLAAWLILSPFNEYLPSAGSFIKPTKKAGKTALKSVINNKPAAAGFAGLIWLKAENSISQASQPPARRRQPPARRRHGYR